MTDPDDNESSVRRLIADARDRTRERLNGIRRAVEKSVPRDQKLKLKTPHPIRWPDGRKLRFTHLVREGRHIFLTSGQSEKARIDLFHTAELESLAGRIPGFRFPEEDSTNVLRFPKKN